MSFDFVGVVLEFYRIWRCANVSRDFACFVSKRMVKRNSKRMAIFFPFL